MICWLIKRMIPIITVIIFFFVHMGPILFKHILFESAAVTKAYIDYIVPAGAGFSDWADI